MTKELKIFYRKVSELIPYEKNPRKNDAAVDPVANSIKEFGFKVPIILDENDVIIAGHTRLKAALKLGLQEVPTVVADDLTEEQVKAFRLADNKVGELSEWDIDKLLDEFDGLDFNWFDFGFGDLQPENNDTIDFDIDAESNQEGKIAVRIVFADYKEYKKHESEIKLFCESSGAEMSVKSE